MNITDFTNLYEAYSSIGLQSDFRNKCMAMFNEHGLPTRKQEAWRYANINSWSLPHDLAMPAASVGMPNISKELLQDIDIVNYNGTIVVLNDIPGVTVSSIQDILSQDENMLDEFIASKVKELCPQNPFIAYALACLSGGMYIKVDDNINNIEKLRVLNYKDKNVFVNELNWLDLGENSKLDLAIQYLGDANSSYWSNSLNYIYLAENSSLKSEVLQNDSDLAVVQHNSIVMQDKASSYVQQEFAGGAKISRSEYTVYLNAAGATADLSGVNHIKAGSWHNTHIKLEHLASNCISKQNFRSILHSGGVGVFLGHIYVPQGVKGSEAYQDSKNMLLGTNARAIAKPYLEIYTDDVVCTHSATVGQLDKDMLFFLLSRGLGRDDAILLLLKSFICEIFAADEGGLAMAALDLITSYNTEMITKTSEELC